MKSVNAILYVAKIMAILGIESLLWYLSIFIIIQSQWMPLGDCVYHGLKRCVPPILILVYLHFLNFKYPKHYNLKLEYLIIPILAILLYLYGSQYSFFALTSFHWSYEAVILYIIFGYILFRIYETKTYHTLQSLILTILTLETAGFINELPFIPNYIMCNRISEWLTHSDMPLIVNTSWYVLAFLLLIFYLYGFKKNMLKSRTFMMILVVWIGFGIYWNQNPVYIEWIPRLPSLCLILCLVHSLKPFSERLRQM